MARKGHKPAEEQVGAQYQEAASADMTMEQMFQAMMHKQQEIKTLMLKMMAGQQTLEKELEQQTKELKKEREQHMRDEDWLRNMEFLDMTSDEGDKVGELQKQASRVAEVKRNVDGFTLEERAT